MFMVGVVESVAGLITENIAIAMPSPSWPFYRDGLRKRKDSRVKLTRIDMSTRGLDTPER
jgi:hypothetical protein